MVDYLLSMPSLHARLAGLTLIALVLWGATMVQLRQRTEDALPTAEFAIEHSQAGGISVTRTVAGLGPVDIRNDSDETVHVSIPETWQRDEVRGAPLASVIADEPSLGFRRWALPARSSVTFMADHLWNKLHIRNISDVPLRLKVVTVDVDNATGVTESTLIDDESLLRFR
jgi:hypothetical protein